MKVVLVTAKYVKRVNMIRERRRKVVDSVEKAEKWLNKIKRPAMFYIEGSFDTEFPQFCYNDLYKAERLKIID
jgi:hypothetical protein